MDIFQLKEQFELNNINFDESQINLLNNFMNFTLKSNEKFNLTSIIDVDSFIEKMIFDSALPLKYVDFNNKSCIDIGTGAGFPGMVLKILSNGKFTLLDSTKKKIDNLKIFATENKIDINLISDRCENFSKQNREKFDIAIARAVAPLNILIELITPLVKEDGIIVALKGPGAEKEIEISQKAFKKLGIALMNNYEDGLPYSHDKRSIIMLKKLCKTSLKYPREYAEILKNPL